MSTKRSDIHPTLDDVDRSILRRLMADGRASIASIAEDVGLSETPCARRIRLLEAAGIIEGYGARVNADALGFGIAVMIFVKLKQPFNDHFVRFGEAVEAMPEVRSCHFLAGAQDFILEVRVREMSALETFLRDRLSTLDSVDDFESMISIRELFTRASLPI